MPSVPAVPVCWYCDLQNRSRARRSVGGRMLPLLIVLGATGAVLELKRLVARPSSDDDSFKFQQNEEKLKRILQVAILELATCVSRYTSVYELVVPSLLRCVGSTAGAAAGESRAPQTPG